MPKSEIRNPKSDSSRSDGCGKFAEWYMTESASPASSPTSTPTPSRITSRCTLGSLRPTASRLRTPINRRAAAAPGRARGPRARARRRALASSTLGSRRTRRPASGVREIATRKGSLPRHPTAAGDRRCPAPPRWPAAESARDWACWPTSAFDHCPPSRCCQLPSAPWRKTLPCLSV